MQPWVRKLPHFTYGKCGGGRKDCAISDANPIDWMDRAFRAHDKQLWRARTQKGIDQADRRLARKLRKGDPKKLGWYGKIYRLGAMMVFRNKK